MGIPDWFERQTYEAEFGEEGAFGGYGRTVFSPDEKSLASVIEIHGDWADDSIVLADVPTLRKQNLFQAQGHITDLAWTPTLWQNLLQPDDGIYAGGFLGGAVHDGNLSQAAHNKKALGTRALYHIGLEAGYQITPTYSVEGYFAHLSNANASRRNAGLNDIGIRAGFKF